MHIDHSFRIRIMVYTAILVFIIYFSLLSLGRVRQLWASYFDLGIMHQTVYNSYMSLREADASRMLELTDPHGSGRQIKRMAIHNDVILGLLAPLYFIYEGPETLLIFQILVTASGAYALYKIAQKRQLDRHSKGIWLWFIPLLYLLYPPLERATLYEFHAVTLCLGLVPWMYYAWICKRYRWFTLLLVLAMMTKEHVGLTIGVWMLVELWRSIGRSYISLSLWRLHRWNRGKWLIILTGLGAVVYSLWSVFVLMPSYRSDAHFALSYFGKDPIYSHILFQYLTKLFSTETVKYSSFVFGPLTFASLLSPLALIALPDILINLLSSSPQMQSFYFHYTALITPWVFIALIDVLDRHKNAQWIRFLPIVCLIGTLLFCYIDSPLPLSLKNETALLGSSASELADITLFRQIVSRDDIAVSATGQLAPYLTSRRYYYDFGPHYVRATYVILRLREIYEYAEKEKLIPIYEKLRNDKNYSRIYKNGDVEVYQRAKM